MSSKTSGPPSGWYPEHPGSRTYRLWDGEQWTHYTQDAANDPPPVTLTAGPETPATNVFIWLMALLPIASAIGVLPWDIHSYLAAHTTADRTSVPALDPTQQALQITNVLVYIASVILGYADYRRLGQNRFARRFHWALGVPRLRCLHDRAKRRRSQPDPARPDPAVDLHRQQRPHLRGHNRKSRHSGSYPRASPPHPLTHAPPSGPKHRANNDSTDRAGEGASHAPRRSLVHLGNNRVLPGRRTRSLSNRLAHFLLRHRLYKDVAEPRHLRLPLGA
jgi:hypothetical protein